MENKKKPISRSVIVLGFVSFFTDISSEMIYPLLPVFLISVIGADPTTLGLIEGVAESVASVFKLISGLWTDRMSVRKPLIVFGYSLSSLARPLIGLCTSWGQILGLRFIDRMGKGFRTTPRDALVSDVTPENERGRAYGFHRAMDHWGAVTGPLISSALMLGLGLKIQNVFLLASIPAALAVFTLVFFLKEKRKDISKAGENKKDSPKKTKISLSAEWAKFPFSLKGFFAAVFVFYLGQSSDAFLLLRLKDVGVPESYLPALWALLHIIKATTSQYFGNLSDRLGHQKMIVFGWIYYAFIYLGFAYISSSSIQVLLFLIYGVYYGLVEAPEKALISKIAPPAMSGGAFGFYHLIVGVSSLPASLLFGWIWSRFGASAAFSFGAAVSIIALLMLPKLKSQN